MSLHFRLFRFLTVSSLFLLAPGSRTEAAILSDPLTGAQVDATHWTSSTPNAGVTLQATSTGVLMTVAGSASGTNLYARLMSACTLVGDFDVQVDYALGPWFAHSGVRTALGTGVGPDVASHAAVERVSLSDHDVVVQTPASEVYLADFLSVNPFPDVATADTQGTFRLTRTGSVETAYFGTAGAWTMLYATTTTSDPVNTFLQTWSDDQFFDTTAGGGSVTFRNYVVTSGQLNCPDGGRPDSGTTDGAQPDGQNSGKGSSGCGCDLATGRISPAGAGLLSLAILALLLRRRTS
jgi:hypothetical protein